ncbi:FYVE zinc finger-domain-containing protein [Dichotomopilus funicola]|uniref:FYVE zinc finger-domain-containing protein n=1 Tax=Dichotomopilus funicola TaxID=1934379 RepID=A0AAN6ZRU4_9PEZI|nr:FYVE zinc finger-domain-containing protein [Dichotomopilus funicola]
MATPDDVGGLVSGAHVPLEIDDDSQSTSSQSTSQIHDLSQHLQIGGNNCPWRTERYFDQECSRYFDCPSHIVERALSDTDDERGGQAHQEEGSESEEEESDVAEGEGDAEPGSVSPLSEDDSDRSARSLSPEAAPETTNVSEGQGPSGPPTREQQRVPVSANEFTSGGNYRAQQESERPAASQSSGWESLGAASSTSSLGIRTMADLPSRPSVDTSTGSFGSVVSPSEPSRGLPTPTQHARSELQLPRWQPDSEQTYCPICGTQFSFFVRKHHCRKCGRVVCNSCSPHRITIPHQYIVRPPHAPRPAPHGPPLSLLDSQGWYPEFSGGEKVRLCNPCVPDPNVAPPHDQGRQPRSRTELNSPGRVEISPSDRLGFYLGVGSSSDAHTRTRSVTLQPGLSSSRPHIPPPPRSNEARILWGTPPGYYRPTSSSQPTSHHYPGTIASRYRSAFDVSDRPGPSSSAIGRPSGSSSASRHFHSPVPPRPQIAEEDECPVCHRELPPRTLPNFESLREAHITSCITSHSRYGGPSTTPPTGAGGAGANDDNPDALPDGPPPPPPRRTGMFPYAATEKDCVDSAECSICLEEFEVGVLMARLECLCRFHRRCINAWWERHPGRCPMHQHDGFGY